MVSENRLTISKISFLISFSIAIGIWAFMHLTRDWFPAPSEIHKELRRRKVIRTKNITGELGEYFVVNHYNKTPNQTNLFLPGPGVKNIDALSRKGERYSIKTISGNNRTTGSFWNPDSIKNNEKTFEYLIICILDDYYSLSMILELTWNDFIKFKKFNKRMNNFQVSVTQKLIDEVKVVYKKS